MCGHDRSVCLTIWHFGILAFRARNAEDDLEPRYLVTRTWLLISGGEEEAGGVQGEEEEGADHRQPARLQAVQQRRHHARPGDCRHLSKNSPCCPWHFPPDAFEDEIVCSRAVFAARMLAAAMLLCA